MPSLTRTRQTKFRKFVEAAGYKLVNGAVVHPDSAEAKAAAATPHKGGRPKKNAEATRATKKRKRDMAEETGDDEGAEEAGAEAAAA